MHVTTGRTIEVRMLLEREREKEDNNWRTNIYSSYMENDFDKAEPS